MNNVGPKTDPWGTKVDHSVSNLLGPYLNIRFHIFVNASEDSFRTFAGIFLSVSALLGFSFGISYSISVSVISEKVYGFGNDIFPELI